VFGLFLVFVGEVGLGFVGGAGVALSGFLKRSSAGGVKLDLRKFSLTVLSGGLAGGLAVGLGLPVSQLEGLSLGLGVAVYGFGGLVLENFLKAVKCRWSLYECSKVVCKSKSKKKGKK